MIRERAACEKTPKECKKEAKDAHEIITGKLLAYNFPSYAVFYR